MTVADASDPDRLRAEFRSDRETGKTPLRREKAYPELRDGMSAFSTLEAARDVWQAIRAAAAARGQPVRIGSHVAEVALEPDKGFDIEDLGEPDGHVTIWGDTAQLTSAVCRIEAAES